MPIIERIDGRVDGRTSREWNDEPGERYLSHTVLEYGDYTGGGADVPAANMRELPGALGLTIPPENEWWNAGGIERERGGYGYVRAWVRVDVVPDGWTLDFNEPAAPSDWESHVREVLASLDNYPLFDDESHSEIVDEWAREAWKSDGRPDVLRDMRKAGGEDFAEYLGEIDAGLPYGGDYEPWTAEGGEGGIYFDSEHCAALLTLEHFPAFAAQAADDIDVGGVLWNLSTEKDGTRYLSRLAGWENKFDLSTPAAFGVLADYLETAELHPEWLIPLRAVVNVIQITA